MKTRIIHTKIWQDSFFADLNPTEKLVFIYLLTNERVNIIHCYECPERVIAFETGVSRDVIDMTKQKLFEAGKIRVYKDWIHLVNADRYEQYTGDKNEMAKEREMKLMPHDVISWYKAKSDTPIYTPMDTPIDGVYIPPINHKSEIINQKKGGVGGNNAHGSFDWLREVPDDECAELAHKFEIDQSQVQSKADDLVNYCLSKGKTYKDYRALLMNALKRDIEDGRIRKRSAPSFKDVDAILAQKGGI